MKTVAFRNTTLGPDCYGYPTPQGQPPCWLYWEKPFELAYLSWGERCYGERPARERAHDGWHYFVVLAGSPYLYVNGRLVQTQPGWVSICHPSCVKGNRDEAGRRCEMLTWIWRSPPAHSTLQPSEGDFVAMTVDRAALRRLKALHARCREAVANADERSLLELRVARPELDLCLLDGCERPRGPNADFRIDLATEYLRNHLHEQEPVKKLCQYLHISEASLKRLFRDQTGKSPREFALGWRMQWAHEQLTQHGATVKAVAFALGYRHANDFSRAFKRHHGTTATRALAQTAPTAAG